MGASISYAVCSHNEGEALNRLINRILDYITADDELIILDDHSTDSVTRNILNEQPNVFTRKFNLDFAEHKNYLNSKCTKEYIFQLDGDELPTKYLLERIPELIRTNPDTDLFVLPRVNLVRGITQEHLTRYKWKTDKFNRINYPDYQGRIFKNKKELYWKRPVHEVVVGHKKYTKIQQDKNLDILHVKSIDKQEKSNLFYYNNYTSDFKIKK